MKRDYYEILGLQKTASEAEIKKSYRKYAMKYHPDKNPDDKNAEELFKEGVEANEILSDPETRDLYDQYGHDWRQVGQDPFAAMRREQERRRNRGKNVHTKVSLTLKECYDGCEKEIPFNIQKTCNSCNGTKAKNGTSMHTCTNCGGAGQVNVIKVMGGFRIQDTIICNTCRGVGSIIDENCGDCSGYGTIVEKEIAVLTFPRGVKGGDSLMAEGKGHYPRVLNASRGDAIFVVDEIVDETFERLEKDLVHKLKISYEDLVLGTKVIVPTIHGKEASIVVSPGSKNGKLFRIRGHGMPILNLSSGVTPTSSFNNASFGNYIIELELDIPDSISEEEKELIQQLKRLRSKNLDKV